MAVPDPALHRGRRVKQMVRTSQMEKLAIPLYNCPSRRTATFHPNTSRSLTDYAATVGGPSRSEIGDAQFNLFLADNEANNYPQFNAKQEDCFWGCVGCTANSARGIAGLIGKTVKIRGVIQRGDWTPVGAGTFPKFSHLGFMTKMTTAKINDGTSKTLMISEKWVHTNLKEGDLSLAQADDKGWTDGWDFDAVRSTLITPRSDGAAKLPSGQPTDPGNYTLGSAHSGGIQAVNADGSVQSIAYDINLEILNRLGNRADGEVIDSPY